MKLPLLKSALLLILLSIIISLTFQLLFTRFTTHANNETPHPEQGMPKNNALQTKDIFQRIEEEIPNLPVSYWRENQMLPPMNRTCAPFPHILDLHYSNTYWQILQTNQDMFYLLSAYYDNRPLVRTRPVVRILAVMNRFTPIVPTYCQLRYEGQSNPEFSAVNSYRLIWSFWSPKGNSHELLPYLITCRVFPDGLRVPKTVSLVRHPCDKATNLLQVTQNLPANGIMKPFAVCVKALDFPSTDVSARLVEWVELLTILGADKVFFYEFSVHQNVRKVLDHYIAIGKAEVIQLTLPGNLPNGANLRNYFQAIKRRQKRFQELIPYNDCLYRNINRYQLIAVLDVDEVIVPKKVHTWAQLFQHLVPKASVAGTIRASYFFRNAYFLDVLNQPVPGNDIPALMHMLNSVYRTGYAEPGAFVKSFVNAERVLTVHNHQPFACVEPSACDPYGVSLQDAHLQHFRVDCVKELHGLCGILKKNSTLDTTLWKYKEELVNRTMGTLHSLGFIQEP